MVSATRPTALVTGASTGLGVEFATLLAPDHDLILTARSTEKLHTLAEALRRQHHTTVHVIPLDLAVAGSAARLMDAITGKNLRVDVLINNAGFAMQGLFAQSDPSTTTQLLQLNMVSLTELARLVLPGMLASKSGRVMNVASSAAFLPGPLMAVYYASKAYVLSFSLALSNETLGTGVTVTCLCPGPTRTNFAERAGLSGSKLFGKGALDARVVAARGLAAMRRGKALCIPSASLRLQLFPVRFLPRSLAARFARAYNTVGEGA